VTKINSQSIDKRPSNKTMRNISALIVVAFCFLITSCASYKNIPYFKNLPDSTYVYKNGVKINATVYEELKIQPDDILQVTIETIDPELNNVMGTGIQVQTGNNVQPGKPNSADITGYLVNKEGMIELPIAGKIKVGGLTTAEAKEAIRLKATTYYKEPVVNVRIVNFKVTVLGEVARPGAYIINGEKATILDALGQAGDMTIFGIRKNVLLSRLENGQQKMVRFDLNSTDIFDSPYFYLRQGDIVYVQPSKGKAAANDGAMLRTYTIISSTLSLLVVIASRVN
jgi:polysaccharide export outer membrane protein